MLLIFDIFSIKNPHSFLFQLRFQNFPVFSMKNSLSQNIAILYFVRTISGFPVILCNSSDTCNHISIVLSKFQFNRSILRPNIFHILMALFFSQSVHFTHSDSSGTISRISSISHFSATHILSNMSVLTFSFLPSFAIDALLIPAFLQDLFHHISVYQQFP